MALPRFDLLDSDPEGIDCAFGMAEKERQLRRRIEEAAQEWQQTFDASESAVLVFSAKQTLRRLNRAALALLGGIYQDHLGKPLSALGEGAWWREVARVLSEVSESQRTIRSHCTVGERTWALSADLIPAEEAGRERFLVVLKDVTDLLELQSSLRRSELLSTMGALVAGVAHEVRNPLFGISAGLDALALRLSGKPEVEADILLLRQHVARLKGLTSELLEYGKPACRTLAAIGLAELVERAARGCLTLAGSLGIELVQQVPAELPPVKVDAERLEAVFSNLIENALQHSPPAGRVVVSGFVTEIADRPAVRCLIEDCGPGFASGDLEQVFEPFFSRRRGGTGLGLSIVRRVVEGHGGKVIANNRAEGGARVSVDLPCAPKATPAK